MTGNGDWIFDILLSHDSPRHLTQHLMTGIRSSGLLETLADPRLFTPGQFEEFTERILPLCSEPWILAQELVYRGWLTPFQISHIANGSIESLFLGSYVLLEPLGSGGMGQVYRARHNHLDKTVAVKLLRDRTSRNPAMVTRFQREIRALGQLNHPNIVMAFDAGRSRSRWYYAMEYVSGSDLGKYVAERGPLPLAEACDIINQTAAALQYAYEHGLVHRDVKPSNILFTDSTRTAKLLDLGLTRCEIPMEDSAFGAITDLGILVGTPDYMSPEQVMDCRRVDIRSDLYSLGCTFYHLLTGEAPFASATTTLEKVTQHCQNEPVPVEERQPRVTPRIAGIVRKLMAKRPRDRFNLPCELMEELRLLKQSKQDLPERSYGKHRQESQMIRPLPATDVFSVSEIALHGDSLSLAIRPHLWFMSDRVRRIDFLQLLLAVMLATLGMLLLWSEPVSRGESIVNPKNYDWILPADDEGHES